MIYKNLIVLAAFGAVFLHPIATNTIITAEDNDIDDNVTNFPYHDDILEVENIVCGQNLLETMYVSSSIGKSHRFYLTQGERKNGDSLLANSVKQTGWKNPKNATVTLKYPENGSDAKTLTFVHVIVYQGSTLNKIHVSNGGIGNKSIEIVVEAFETKYLRYNATFYGL